MALFSSSLIRDYSVDEALIATRWANFQKFLSKTDFVRDVKEEKYQDGFLKDIFESCLGYTLDSTDPSSFNLEREKKNETDSKKADGAIYLKGQVVGIIELKDQKTKNLDAIEVQAFNYHNSHANSRYIIISNFDELRFYIDKKTAYEKFNLFNLTYDEFKKLHLLLSFESIHEGLPITLKERSANFEATISKALYKDFSAFRTHLFENIVKNNYHSVIPYPDTESISASSNEILNQVQDDKNATLDKQTLLRLTQKLCDRIVFILFAEDRGLLKANTILSIREHFHNQAFTNFSLYDIYKFYFDAISNGNEKLGIPKYNGGLFAKDEMMDSLVIDDECLDMEAQKLSDYDFESDISVNILGHIFEQSLTDLEEMEKSFSVIPAKAGIHKTVSKRKKDGVFYTPEYITRYIVENTLGKLCNDKKAELNIENIEAPKDSRKPTKKEQITKENLEVYRNWLLDLKILDPACGSGAFLNQALEFLIREHKSLQQNLVIMGDITAFYDIEEGILEHNLYGVDINEDAVEIAKLSLWLRTAHKGRALTNLSSKIKCGNSLIDDKSVAKNAFVWEDEFPEVFNPSVIPAQAGIHKKGFDVVIGNPPYGATISVNDKKYLKENYSITEYNFDTYNFFFELSIMLLREDGYLGFITPNTFLVVENGTLLRDFLFKKNRVIELFESFDVFPDAVIEPIVSIIQKRPSGGNDQFKVLLESRDKKAIEERYFLHKYIYAKNKMIFNYRETLHEKNLYEKIVSKSKFLSQFALVTSGIKPYQTGKGIPKQTNKIVEEKPFTGFEQKEGLECPQFCRQKPIQLTPLHF
ncbi:MAG: N-6 DNA methylase [Campylobacterales bacterium]|nr:N-6 DNA methylase [Campylobacterales bacterium]